ncbi:unnamed protein product [Rotaria magnacalcarata]|uniref:Calcium-dependent secretion activator 1 n=1 Tax=Rotaria magnacalcarata TaxID=392030 RepID=A0A816RII0_9BILA|nr:unnamed protein product [Rotaria magnacalcarata]
MLHDSSDEDEGGGFHVGQQQLISSNRPAIAINQPTINHESIHDKIVSPLLSPKSEHLSSNHYCSPPQSSLYTSPTSTHRTLPKIPTNSNTNSSSLSLRSSTNTNVFSDTHQQLMVIQTDSASMKSDDSSNFSDGNLHPFQKQNSMRNQDIKIRSQQHNSSIKNANKSLINSSTVSTTSNTVIAVIDRVPSPSTSLISDHERDENERLERELELKCKRLQVYVFICRCIACPFNSKQSSDMARKHLKITLVQYNVIKERFLAFLNGKTHIEADEAFTNAVRSYYEVFLKSERVAKIVQSGGSCSDDFRDVFRINIEKRVRSLPDIDSLKISKDTVLTLWMSKFDAIYRGQDQDPDNLNSRVSKSNYMSTSAELIMTKEQLYDMFQNILSIKKFEHQMIFNSAQLDNNDEQAATIRRELDGRMKQAESLQRQRGLMPKFVHKEMDSLYVDELKKNVNDLMINLESLPVRGGSEQKLLRSKRAATHNRLTNTGGDSSGLYSSNKSLYNDTNLEDTEPGLSKLAFVLNFNVNITCKEVRGLKSIPTNRIVYCTMEVESGEKYRTEHAEAGKPVWESLAEFPTNQILPIIKVKLFMENPGILSLDDNKLGKLSLQIDPTFNKTNWWVDMIKTKNTSTDELKVKLDVRMEKPQNLKMCGWCYARGKNVWKTWKRRYYALVQVSQYCFATCSYREKKSEPTEMMPLEGYTVDYAEPDNGKSILFQTVKFIFRFSGLIMHDAKYFLKAVREGDVVTFATNEENERHSWVQALYRATGQAHKPTPPITATAKSSQGIATSGQKDQIDGDRSKILGFDEYIQSDPCKFDHHDLFKALQTATLDFRLSDPYCSLGWLSPGQSYVLEEYCSRYGVRGCLRHLYYLNDLLDRAEQTFMIDPQLLHYSYVFCASHVSGNRPDSSVSTITMEEKDRFYEIKQRLKTFLEHQVTNFRFAFPFGRPDGALKATLSLLERVLAKDLSTPISRDDIRYFIRKCLENAAYTNYTRVSDQAKIEEIIYNNDDSPRKKIDDLIHLAELCIELLQQDCEHYQEAFKQYNDLLIEHEEIFWSLFAVDMEHVIDQQPIESWDSFPLFQLLNDYLRLHGISINFAFFFIENISLDTLSNGRFHQQLRDTFAPLVIRYVDLMESCIAQSIHKGFEKENWKSKTRGCATSEDMLWKLDALQCFIRDLHWPDAMFGEHLEKRLKQMASDMIEACGKRIWRHFEIWIKKGGLIGGTSADYLLPSECCVMVNVILDCKVQALKLCALHSGDLHQYHTRIDEYLERILGDMSKSLIQKLVSVLDSVLKKLSRYDEGSFFAQILSLTKPINEDGQAYVSCINANLEQLRQRISDEIFTLNIFEEWYRQQTHFIFMWLGERTEISLHPYQLACLLLILKKTHGSFELQGVQDKDLNSQAHSSIMQRLHFEETANAVK